MSLLFVVGRSWLYGVGSKACRQPRERCGAPRWFGKLADRSLRGWPRLFGKAFGLSLKVLCSSRMERHDTRLSAFKDEPTLLAGTFQHICGLSFTHAYLRLCLTLSFQRAIHGVSHE